MKKQTIKIGEIANYEDGLVRGRKEGRLSAQEEIKGLKNSIAKLIIDNTHIKEDILADAEKIIDIMKFCVYCMAAPEFCKCNNKIKFAIWAEPFKDKLAKLAKDKL